MSDAGIAPKTPPAKIFANKHAGVAPETPAVACEVFAFLFSLLGGHFHHTLALKLDFVFLHGHPTDELMHLWRPWHPEARPKFVEGQWLLDVSASGSLSPMEPHAGGQLQETKIERPHWQTVFQRPPAGQEAIWEAMGPPGPFHGELVAFDDDDQLRLTSGLEKLYKRIISLNDGSLVDCTSPRIRYHVVYRQTKWYYELLRDGKMAGTLRWIFDGLLSEQRRIGPPYCGKYPLLNFPLLPADETEKPSFNIVLYVDCRDREDRCYYSELLQYINIRTVCGATDESLTHILADRDDAYWRSSRVQENNIKVVGRRWLELLVLNRQLPAELPAINTKLEGREIFDFFVEKAAALK